MYTSSRLLLVPILLLTALLAIPFAYGQDPTFPPARNPLDVGDPPPVPGDDDMTVQPRGPVHEAFATAPNMAPRPGPVLSKKPPAPIPELPPDQKPEGDNVQWIPGYWAWDADRNDYLWISGLWRVPPTGRKWMPGAWNTVEGGYRWSPGFWAAVNQDDMQYLPPPPASLDNGPSSPQPNDDSFYVPGNWLYQSSNYLWQPGYWQTFRPGTIWTPACYNWTPGGYLYVPGFWDWPFANRGLLFAPVAFNRPLWNTPGWSYRPSYCVGTSGMLSSLFIGPTGGGYYFGNYYGPSYRRLGFQPWFASAGGVNNPLFGWYRWRNLSNPGWTNGIYTAYRGRYNGSLARPPLVFNRTNIRNRTVNSMQIVQPLSQFNSLRLARLSAAQVNEHRQLAQRIPQFSTQRQNVARQAGQQARGSLPLSRLPRPATVAVHAAPASIHPTRTVSPGNVGSRIIAAHHTTGGAAPAHPQARTSIAPRIATAGHSLPAGARIGNGVIAHPNPAPVAHRTPPAPAHCAAPPSHGGGRRR